MDEFVIRVDVPKELAEDFKRVLEELVEESRTRPILSLIEKSRLTEKEAVRLGEEIKRGIAEKQKSVKRQLNS